MLKKFDVQKFSASFSKEISSPIFSYNPFSFSLPTQKDEAWQYTDISPIFQHSYKIKKNPSFSKKTIQDFLNFGFDAHRMVFVNGHFSSEYSDIDFSKSSGITLQSVKTLAPRDFQKCFFSAASNIFTALNTAYSQDGVFFSLKKGTKCAKPIHLVFLSGDTISPIIAQPRNYIFISEQSSVQILESHYSLSSLPVFSNSVTDINIAHNAFLDYVRLYHEKENAFHIQETNIIQNTGSIARIFTGNFGAGFFRDNLNIQLNAEDSSSHLYGCALASLKQHIDNRIVISHKKPHCCSKQFYKSIADGKSTYIFDSQIIVQKGAQKTNAFQTSKNLLLSGSATIHAKPQLNIYADDVNCRHGVTIGQIETDALFYARSRGISPMEAKKMLLQAFFYDILEYSPISFIRSHIENILFKKLTSLSCH